VRMILHSPSQQLRLILSYHVPVSQSAYHAAANAGRTEGRMGTPVALEPAWSPGL